MLKKGTILTARSAGIARMTIIVLEVFTFCKAGATIILGSAAALLIAKMLSSTGSEQTCSSLEILLYGRGMQEHTNVFSVFATALKL